MTNQFGEKIKSLEAQLNKLKTVGMSSSSSLGVATTNVPVQFQIIATRIVSGEVLECYSSKYANVYVRAQNNAPIILSNEVITSAYNRGFYCERTLSDISGYKYKFKFYLRGNDDDLAALNRGETLPILSYTFRIKATEQFNYQLIYTDMETY